MVDQTPTLELKLPTFSSDTDWDSKDTEDELLNAVSKIGFGYWLMNDYDKSLYNKVYPKILS